MSTGEPLVRVSGGPQAEPVADAAEIEAFFHEFFRPLVRRAVRRHRLSTEDARDVVQEARSRKALFFDDAAQFWNNFSDGNFRFERGGNAVRQSVGHWPLHRAAAYRSSAAWRTASISSHG